MITSIIKRDGSIEPFNPEKIVIAISKAGSATGEFDTQVSKELVQSMVLPRINAKKGRAVSVEDVQDIVENVLFDTAFEKSYKAYTLYRENRRQNRETKKALIDVEKSMNEYLRQDDWRVKANANQGYSLGGMILNISGKITANYWLNNVYPEEVGVAHRNGDYHIHDLDMLSGYCAGWSLRSLLNEGFNGVANKVESNPPKHVSSALLQMVNFLGSLQNEWAGAQAFSSFDTYLAPFVRVDKLSYEELKQRIQEFIYNLNVPSRWGCVPTSTEILTLDGWKSVYSLKKTDVVYSVGEKGELRLSNINTIVHKAKAKRKMIAFKNTHYGYEQYVTDNHRCITTTANKKLDECKIALAEEIKNRFNEGLTVKFPVKLINTNVLKNTNVLYPSVTNTEVMFASAMYCDASFDYRGDSLHKVTYFKSTRRQAPEWFEQLCEELRLKYTKTIKPSTFSDELCHYVFYGEDARRIEKLIGHKNKIEEKFLHMSAEQSRLFLETWAKHDGEEEKLRLQFDTDCICKGLQHIAINAGYTSHIYMNGKTRYVKIRQIDLVEAKECVEIEEECEVWCPSVTHGTVIFRDKNGNVFLSGNTQTPFTNLTFDIHCPEDIRDDIPLIGGKEVDFKYDDLQKEMDMINKAYMEVMIAGDAHGRIFTFPIPTYNISKDFDWDSANSELLFEMTAKYGLPYFQNFINSELKPNQIRSMCPLSADTKVLVRINGTVHRSLIKDIDAKEYETFYCGEWHKAKLVKVEPQRKIKVTTSSGDVITFGEHHLQPVYRKDKFETIEVNELKKGDWLPFNKHSYDSEFGSYKLGFAIGAYLGDGSRNGGETGGVTYTIGNKDGSLRTIELLRSFWEELGYRFTVKEEKNIWRINVGGNSFQVLRRFVTGTTALTKGLDGELFRTSKLTRLGVIDGLMMTDGSREKRRLYSSSKKLIEDIRDLVHGLGLKALLSNEDARTTEEGKLSDNVCYCLSLPLRTAYGSFFKEVEGFTLYQVTDIVKQNVSSDLYCFEVENEEHLFTLANGLVTHNCRLQLDLRELLKRGNGLFGSAEQTGSVGVVTINCARLGYVFKGDKEGLYKRLDYLMGLAKTSLEIKRKEVQKHMDQGLFPFTKRYLGTLRNHFSTIGVNGINEMIRNFTNDKFDITSEEGHAFAIEFLDHVRAKMVEYQEETGNLYNLEATPAEGTTYRFAKEDKKRWPDIIQAGTAKNNYYTNSSQLPVGFTDDPFEALEMQDDLQRKYTGGTVLHLYMGERISTSHACKELVKRALTHFKLPYITITPTFSICPKHGYIAGEHKFCPLCDDELVARKKRALLKCQKAGTGK